MLLGTDKGQKRANPYKPVSGSIFTIIYISGLRILALTEAIQEWKGQTGIRDINAKQTAVHTKRPTCGDISTKAISESRTLL